MIYLDTSAFLKLYVAETGSEIVQDAVISQNDPVPVWNMLQAEMFNALRLKVFWHDLSPEEADRLIALFDARLERGQYFTPELDRNVLLTQFRSLSEETPQTGCRTMDILHVACAKLLTPEHFVTFDQRQRSLAEFAGLSVLPSRLDR